MNKGELDVAIVEFREAIRVQPNFADAHLSLGALRTASFLDPSVLRM